MLGRVIPKAALKVVCGGGAVEYFSRHNFASNESGIDHSFLGLLLRA